MASNCKAEETNEDDLSNVVDKIKSLDIKSENQEKRGKIACPKWLEDCESPLKWHTSEVQGLGSETLIQRTHEKLDDLKMEGPEFSLYGYVALLKLVVHYYLVGEMQQSKENMRCLEELVETENNGSDQFYKHIQLAVEHVTLATKAHLLALDDQEEESQQISASIIPVKVLGAHDLAALYVMKADFFLYSGYEEGEHIAVELAREALELDSNPEWEFYLAKVLRQQRKEVPFSAEIPREEVTLLERAVEKAEDKTKYLVYLAQVYRECGVQAFRKYRNQPNFYSSDFNSAIQKMNEEALSYYKRAIESNPEGPALLRRVGYGIMNLPKKMTDYDLALKCLLKSLSLSENSITLHVLGTYYHRYAKDNRKALEYFERTAQLQSQAGLSDMVRVKFQLDPEYNPVEDLEAGLGWEMKKKHRTQVLVQLAGYFLFIRRDLLHSLQYLREVLAQDPDSPNMTIFKSLFLRMNDPINLYACVVNEALLFLENGAKTPRDASDDVKIQVENFLEEVTAMYPDLKETKPNPSLVSDLLKTSEEIIQQDKKRESMQSHHSKPSRGQYPDKFRGRGGGRGGWGNYNNRGGSTEQSDRRGRFSTDQREGTTENYERRGRYSIANQRERQSSESDSQDRLQGRNQERFQNRNPRYQNQNQHRGNWRQRPRHENSKDQIENERDQRTSSEDNGNWRRRN